jgi:hypothetical protein
VIIIFFLSFIIKMTIPWPAASLAPHRVSWILLSLSYYYEYYHCYIFFIAIPWPAAIQAQHSLVIMIIITFLIILLLLLLLLL